MQDISRGLGPVYAIVVAAALVILGILILIFHVLVAWVVGILIILGGVWLITSLFLGSGGSSRY